MHLINSYKLMLISADFNYDIDLGEILNDGIENLKRNPRVPRILHGVSLEVHYRRRAMQLIGAVSFYGPGSYGNKFAACGIYLGEQMHAVCWRGGRLLYNVIKFDSVYRPPARIYNCSFDVFIKVLIRAICELEFTCYGARGKEIRAAINEIDASYAARLSSMTAAERHAELARMAGYTRHKILPLHDNINVLMAKYGLS